MTTMIQDKDGKIAAAPSTKPSDRHFRNAWVFSEDATAITEDMAEAKKIFQDKIREVRGPLLDAEDVVQLDLSSCDNGLYNIIILYGNKVINKLIHKK